MTRTTTRLLAPLAVLALVGLGACASDAGSDASPSETAESASETPTTEETATEEPTEADAPALSGGLVVLAAASLNSVFTELGDQLMAENPDLTVTFSFAASSALAEQVNAGAPADVLATASAKTMEQVGALAIDPVTFATNTLVIVAPPDNPGAVTGIGDFGNADLRLAVCAEEVPCGAASAEVFEALGLTAAIDTYAENVTAALNLAVSGEVDASLVYATDAKGAAGTVTTIEFAEASEAVNDNLVAALTDAPNPDAAAAFVELVLSEAGQAVFLEAGFAPAS